MSAKQGKTPLILSCLALVVALAGLVLAVIGMVNKPEAAKEPARDVQYVVYLGTNDKDTYEPVCAPEEAMGKVDAVLTKHFEGFTIQDAQGGWTNEDGSVSHEYTLVIYLSDTTIEKVRAAADDLIREFNQSSVLIQANETTTEFYAGT